MELVCPQTPELEKLKNNHSSIVVLDEFLEWLDSQGIRLDDESGWRLTQSSTSLIYRFLGIDGKQVDKERDSLLEHQRKLNERGS